MEGLSPGFTRSFPCRFQPPTADMRAGDRKTENGTFPSFVGYGIAAGLSSRRRDRSEEPLRLGQRGLVAHRLEELACFLEGLFRGGVGKRDEATPAAEECVRALGDVAELPPAIGGLGI